MNDNGDYSERQWDVRTLEQAYLERPPTEYLVERFVATESLLSVYGPPGSLKSMLLANMGAHVAQGVPWLPGVVGEGNKGIPVTQAPVFWLDLDNGLRRTEERFGAIGRALDMPPDAPLYYVSIPTRPPFAANDLEAMRALRDYIVYYRAKLVVIDNLSLITGNVEENNAEMAIIMGNLRVLAERTGAAIVLIHHQRKGGAGQSRAGDALRGHSSIEASLDLALHVAREPGHPEVVVRSTKTRGVDVPAVTARFNFEHTGDGTDLHKAWFDGVPIISGDNPVREMILQVLAHEGEMVKGRLVDEVHDRMHGQVGVHRIRNWVQEMIESTRELGVTEGEYNAQIISVRKVRKTLPFA